MVLPIYLYGHPVLRTATQQVTPDYPDLDKLIQNMKDTMYASDGIGIAAPQVGKSIRLIYIDVDVLKDDMPELKDKRFVLINPVITVDTDSKTVSREEGCLSLPGIHESVTRHDRIHVKWTDENWQQHEEDIEGFLARVFQHEYDHLEETVFVDHLSPIRKQLIKNKLMNIVKGKVSCDYRTVGYKPAKKK
ncbi:MAG: peptide deformylase [Muribaculaceae bacterium]|nr:peptide deformylase [Muribaculaceae bacterium]MBR1475654.1 peptide deformylase [Muribaculaceae bacterium]